MVNYQLGKIYKIVDNTNGNIYIGSTCLPYLCSRLAAHTTDYRCFLKGTCKYVTSFEIIKNGDYDIVLIESFPCDDKMQLYARERYYIETLECVNTNCPIRTIEEKKVFAHKYRKDNIEKSKEYNQQYQETNKEQIKEQRKNYCETHKEQIKEHKRLYAEDHKEHIQEYSKQYREIHNEQLQEQKKQYQETNKEKLKEKHKIHYEAHKDDINAKRREKAKQKREETNNI